MQLKQQMLPVVGSRYTLLSCRIVSNCHTYTTLHIVHLLYIQTEMTVVTDYEHYNFCFCLPNFVRIGISEIEL